MDSRHIGIALASAVGLCARVAQAEIPLPGAILVVNNPSAFPDCVAEQRLAARVLAELPAVAGSHAQTPPRRLEVTVMRGVQGFEAELRMSGRRSGLRRIEASRCEGLTEALAVTVAMILDWEAAPGDAEVPVPSTETSPQLPSIRARTTKKPLGASVVLKPGSVIPVTREPARVPRPMAIRLGVNQDLRAWLGVGIGTNAAWQVESGVGFYLRHWGFQLGVFWQPTNEIRFGTGRVRVMTLGGLAAGCLRFGVDWRGVLCVRADVGGERVRGIDLGAATPQTLPVLHLGPSFGVETGGRWVVGLDLLAQAGIWRDRYVYVAQDSQNEHPTPPGVVWLVARVALSSRAKQH